MAAISFGGELGELSVGATDAFLMILGGGIEGVLALGIGWALNKIFSRDGREYHPIHALWHIHNATHLTKADIHVLNGMRVDPGHHTCELGDPAVFWNDKLDFVANGTLLGAKNEPTHGNRHGHFKMPLPRGDNEAAAKVEGRWITIGSHTASEKQHDAFQHAIKWLTHVPSEDEQDEMVRMLKIAVNDD